MRRSAPPRRRWRWKAKPPQKRCDAAKEEQGKKGRKRIGKAPAPPKQEPDGKAQRNFTDPESRIVKMKDGYIQGYNAQAAVDPPAQIIVVHTLDHNASDWAQFAPSLDAIRANLAVIRTRYRPMQTTARRPTIFAR